MTKPLIINKETGIALGWAFAIATGAFTAGMAFQAQSARLEQHEVRITQHDSEIATLKELTRTTVQLVQRQDYRISRLEEEDARP